MRATLLKAEPPPDIKCPTCGSLVSLSAGLCFSCGTILPDDPDEWIAA